MTSSSRESEDKTVSRLVAPLRHMGPYTRQIFRVLMEGSSTHSLNAKTIAKLTGIKESTVRKVLSRLYNRGVIERECRGFYKSSHETKVGVENWDTSAWKVHGVSLHAFDPDLWRSVLEVGQLTPVEAGNLFRYRACSLLGRWPVEIFPSGLAVYQVHCPAVDAWLVDRMGLDLQLTLERLTRGLMPRIPTYLECFEATYDIPAEDMPDFPEEAQFVKIYRTEHGGKPFIRTEVIFSHVHKLVPLDVPNWAWIYERVQQTLAAIPRP